MRVVIYSYITMCCVNSMSWASISVRDTEFVKKYLEELEPVRERLYEGCYHGNMIINLQAGWPKRKAALQSIIDQYPNNQYADDAAIVLAYGKFEYENDSDAAIAALKQVIKQYPNSQTILCTLRIPGMGFRFEEPWEKAVNGLGDFDRIQAMTEAGEMDQSILIKRAIVYLNHIDKYPRSSKSFAHYLISGILMYENKCDAAVVEIEQVTREIAKFKKNMLADSDIASGKYGDLIEFGTRPCEIAHQTLIAFYEKMNKPEMAKEQLDVYASIVNQGGMPLYISKAGDLYKRQGLTNQARRQYQLALDKLNAGLETKRIQRESGNGSDIGHNLGRILNEQNRNDLNEKLRELN